jgi:hypothetical protein
MKISNLIVLCCCLGLHVSAQPRAGFEDIELPLSGYLNDASPEEAFFSGWVALPNAYFPAFDYWEGWAISAVKDNTTPGFTNQYSAIPGGGAEDTDHYAVGYAFDGVVIRLADEAEGTPVQSLYVTNSTYTYYSMRDGDAFAKKFGGETGADPDFLLLTVRAYHQGQLGQDSIGFYLADYRSPDPADDYLVEEWVLLNLTELGPADSLLFTLTSSDVGIFGMNTPAYFCIDEVLTGSPTSTNAPDAIADWRIWPNPARDLLFTTAAEGTRLFEIRDVQGKLVQTGTLAAGQQEIEMVKFQPGMYYLRMIDSQVLHTIPFVRQ